ncbi:L-glutamate gamma-semialdehyde dehydrogenase [Bdellovibrio bacteriovorus]|uniref:L-glutamate gamma-semialdehyde dehydrogenase n=2 Tax=Bdellovibrio bacteriovorus (strain ATCC 15356 / DSM 50701 / NCIMB 9529 / HD100) TaxID=264462 RepID=Q6MNK1_BDEBA|nr:L-glutamate gamma-semialdehyde dehydrogenase [Bdellovibrio bacteriovorus]AHZ86464.1 1-pyrroline-5-carboxylate dehydrogenase [Bdellovibrio bacteriovorus]BEV67707.1 1-pyrroline-5-carboxylate dehydrogenase [Bdellovibrio bacteriovorus]CAE79150.1 1-pyrroline-5 carboxylate dehydrogenase [Bdellovibrio bacteriovorus HD100]
MNDIQSQIVSRGEEILKRMESQSKASIFSKDFWYGSIMEWSMKNEKFKTNMFRFVDVLPSINSGDEVARHLKEYFSEDGGTLPPVFNVGLGLGSLAPGLMAGAIKKNVMGMAKMFITGESPDEALPVLKKARKNKMTFTVDILGEATLSEKEAQDYSNKYMELVTWLAKDAEKWDEVPQIDRDHEGALPKVNVSVKMTALYSQIKDAAWDESKKILKDRLRPVFRLGMEKGVFVNLDMEQYSVKHLTLEVFTELINEPEFKNYKFFGIVIQAYLRDSFEDVKSLTEFAQKRGTPFWVRLVKGAYWDYETIEAEQRGWPVPVYTNKAESDANYELCAKYLLENIKFIRPAFASHNVRTLAACMLYAEKLNIPKEALEFQMLYGMAEPIKKTIVDMGYRMREYAPVGELIPGMAYLVRRLLENTSNESWLRGKFADNKSMAELLKDPAQGLTPTSPVIPKKPGKFYNEPLLDFAVKADREKMLKALAEAKASLPVNVNIVINNKELQSGKIFDRVNPSQSDQIVGKIQMATTEQAEQAMQAAQTAYKTWKNVPCEQRAALVDKLADIMTRDRFKLIATQVLEVGKPWAEADGDIGEAIDFCRYYARHMRELQKPLRVGGLPGELSHYIYKSRGVTAVIAPWNFPLAILAGMVTAAAVAGNTVVMKPAEQSTVVAWGLMKMIQEAGFPQGVINFLPGYGEEVGEYIVNHKYTTTIAFTGSKAVGLHIMNRAAVVQPGQQHVKRCIIEMGGKNAVIIDNDADLDEAVDGVIYSAFGFSGQKCSAASRVIVLDEVYDRFVDRLVETAKSIEIHPAENPKAYMGPVVDKEAYDRILGTIAEAEKNHKLLFKGSVPGGGFFAPPTIFGDVPGDAKLAQAEIFGPVVAVIRAKNLDQALDIANSTEYALTGGVFSRSPANINRVKEELEVGNLYVNRGITGAMVDRHPFGGFKMSGIGSKTGGPDYLKQYMEPACVTENTLRRGFAPAEE